VAHLVAGLIRARGAAGFGGPFGEGAEFPVFPVEPGISPVLLENGRFVCENNEVNQAFAG